MENTYRKEAKRILKNHREVSPTCALTFTEDAITKALDAREKKGRGEVFLSNHPLRMALQKLRAGSVTRPDVKHFCELDKDEADAVRKEIEKLEPNYGTS